QVLQYFWIALHCRGSRKLSARDLGGHAPGAQMSARTRVCAQVHGTKGKGLCLKRRLENQAKSTIAARAQVLVHHALGGLLAASAAASNGQLVLHIEERTCAAIDSLADVFIGDGMTNADVHSVPLSG